MQIHEFSILHIDGWTDSRVKSVVYLHFCPEYKMWFVNVFLLQKLVKIAGNGSAVTERTEVSDLFVQ